MELKEFISSTLQQICEAIVDAQSQTSTSGAVISPRCNIEKDGVIYLLKDRSAVSTGSSIKFDVALTVAAVDGSENSGSKHALLQIAGVKIGAAGSTGAGDSHRQEQSSISRVQFEIPVLWPMISSDHISSAPAGSQTQRRADTDYDLFNHS